jgi:hypothetical protein
MTINYLSFLLHICVMTPFEYVTVLISIILGLGITQIVTGLADLIHQWDRVKVYWPHLLWIFLIFFLHIQEWWATYELRSFTSWRLISFFFVIIYPIILFILARLWFPLGLTDGTIDLKKFYFENFRRIFGWSVVLIIFALLTNLFVLNYPLLDQLPHFIFLLLLIVVSVGNLRNQLLHELIVILITAISIASIIYTWSRDASIISE